MTTPAISVVAPAYRCSTCLVELHRRVVEALSDVATFELVVVNDASPDDDWAVIRQLASIDPRVRGVNLSRNFGQHHAITAGVDFARGDWVVVMDADLQDRPEEIPRLYRKALEGYDVVFAMRGDRNDTALKKFYSRVFHRVVNALAGMHVQDGISNFSIISRRVADHFRALRERARSYGLLILWLGFPTAYIDVKHGARFAGTTSYTFLKALKFALDALVSQSDHPLRISIRIGFMTSTLAACYAGWLAIKYFTLGVAVPGWTSVMVSLFFLTGVILADLGVIGLYLGKVFDEAKHRPLYVVAEVVNATPDPLPET